MIIFLEGEQGEGLYFVKRGKIKLSTLSDDGKEKILHFCGEGDVFAEVLLFDGGPYPATAETLEDSEIGLIRYRDMEELLRINSEITLKILKVMSRRLRQAQLHARELAFKDAYSRLAGTLLRLAEEYGTVGKDGCIINISLNQQDLANFIGSSRETVARILGDFKREKIIEVDKKAIVIKNKRKLEAWL